MKRREHRDVTVSKRAFSASRWVQLRQNSTFVLLVAEAAEYAFRLRSSSYGGQVGSNPPYGLSPDLSACLRRRDAEPVPIKPAIGIAKERPLPTIAALRAQR
jgi:hypothetical protein